jgi:hypothetical protein
VLCSVAWTWHSKVDPDHKAALLVVATLLASPHVLDYDLTILAPAIAFFSRHGLRRGFRDYEISILGAAWAVPLLARGMTDSTGLPLGLLVLLTLFGMILRRAVFEPAIEKRDQTETRASVI